MHFPGGGREVRRGKGLRRLPARDPGAPREGEPRLAGQSPGHPDARRGRSWGYRRQAKRFREVAFEEMKDAERIIDRILFLEGVPNMQVVGTLHERRVQVLRLAPRSSPQVALSRQWATSRHPTPAMRA